MATITSLSSIGTIDPANDVLAIVDVSLNTTFKVTPNALNGITGAVVGTTDTQTLTSKTLTSPTISGPTLSGTIIGTYTIGGTPTFPATVVTTTASQTLTNKTLTAPSITGGSIDNTTITVDSISGHTTSTIVSVGGVQMNNGTIGTSGAVTTTSIAAGAVVPNSLFASTGTGWVWQTYSPTLTNITIGNGTVIARYVQVGKLIMARVSIVLGSTSAMGSTPQISLPVTAHAGYLAGAESYGNVQLLHTASFVAPGLSLVVDTNNVQAFAVIASGTYAEYQQITSLIPFTWGAGDALYFYLVYEAA